MSVFTSLRRPTADPTRLTATADETPATGAGPHDGAFPTQDGRAEPATGTAAEPATTTKATTTKASGARTTTGTEDNAEVDPAVNRSPAAARIAARAGAEIARATAAARHAAPSGVWRFVRRVATHALTVAAAGLLLAALLFPNELGRLANLRAYARIPTEALLVIALMLVLPRIARVTAALFGLGVGVVAIIKIIDIGFYEVLARPFDPVLDISLFGNAMDFLTDSFGRPGAIAALIGVLVLAAGIPVLLMLAALRLSRLVVRHRTTSARSVAALAMVCLLTAGYGVRAVPSPQVSGLAYHRLQMAWTSLHDKQAFAAQARVDAFRDTPADQLLTALRGKDVIFAFVESYGRDAIEKPLYAERVNAVLESGNGRLRSAGFSARSGFLTSPTAGGGSWLAHATFFSGLWINNSNRYRAMVASDRLTLPAAFRRADWRTVAVTPGNFGVWQEAGFYGYQQDYGSDSLGYRGPEFGWADMPDQYTLAEFERRERGKADRPPLMAELALISSHAPWTPLPHMIPWSEVGDGSEFAAMAAAGEPMREVWKDAKKVRTQYRLSIEYSVNILISYLETYGDDDTVLVFLGDHQAPRIITGADASRDVPISIVARDPAVLERVAGWGWDEGIRPGPKAPVWRMDEFRDRFLTTFGPRGGAATSAQAAGSGNPAGSGAVSGAAGAGGTR